MASNSSFCIFSILEINNSGFDNQKSITNASNFYKQMSKTLSAN